MSSPRAIFAGSPPRFTRSRVTYEAYAVSRTSTRPQVDSALVAHRRDWRTAMLEDVAGFVAWLRLPPKVRDGKVVVLPTVEHHCSVASVNRKLAALTSFCGIPCPARRRVGGAVGHHAAGEPARRGGAAYKPFLHHVTKTKPEQRRAITLRTVRSRPKVLTAQQVQTILDACDHVRDRLLWIYGIVKLLTMPVECPRPWRRWRLCIYADSCIALRRSVCTTSYR